MIGLLRKDFEYLLDHPSKRIVCLIIIMFVSLAFPDTYFLTIFFSFFAILFVYMTFYNDETFKWNDYEQVIPLPPLKTVASKYIFNLILLIMAEVVSFLIYLSYQRNLLFNLVCVVAVFSGELITVAVFIPLLIKFGCYTQGVSVWIVSMIPSFYMILMFLLFFNGDTITKHLPTQSSLTAIFISPIVAIALYILSIKVSENIYKSKEVA